VKLRHLDDWTTSRQRNVSRYLDLFARHGLEGAVGLPTDEPRGRHVWNQFVIRVPGGRRDPLRAHLTACKVGTEIYYPIPLHLQKCFEYLGWKKGDLPETERAAEETLALPIFPELTAAEQETVVARIAEFFGAPRKAVATEPGAALVHGPHFVRRMVGRADEVIS